MMIRTGVVASKSITSAICTLRPCIVHVGIYRPKSGVDFLRGQKHKCPKGGLQSTPSAMADSDVDEYQKRWEASWNAGLKPGEVSVCDSCLHHPLCSLCCGLDLMRCCTVRPPPQPYFDQYFAPQRFDACQSSPALLDLLKRGTVAVEGKRVFVPGCGRGYDPVTFIKAGAKEAIGLELAPSAVSDSRVQCEPCAVLAECAVDAETH